MARWEVARTVETDTTYAWLETESEAVVLTDELGGVLAANSAFEALFAVSPSQLSTAPVEDLIIASRFRPAYRAARRTALTVNPSLSPGTVSECVAVRSDGSEFAVELSVARTGDGASRLATSICDLTADQAFASPTLSRTALPQHAEELMGFGSWEWELETQRMEWSENLFRMHGLEPGPTPPSTEWALARCHPDDRERVRQAGEEALRTGSCPDLRYRDVRPDGSVRHFRAVVASVPEATGRPRALIGAVQDVTERRQAEREIAAHFAVSDALAAWEPGPPGGLRLIRDLAEALDQEIAALWVPRSGALVAWAVWQARTVASAEWESAVREARVKPPVGLVATAWASGAPVRAVDIAENPDKVVHAFAARTGVHGSLAIPATYGTEVLAVLAFGSQLPTVLTDRFMRSLVGIGYEIGHFLVRRRGELSAPVLTPRELQVLQLSATGCTRRQICDELEISMSTVKAHLEHVYRKLEVVDRASAVAEALRQGLIQ